MTAKSFAAKTPKTMHKTNRHTTAAKRVATITAWLLGDESPDCNERAVTRAIAEFGIERRQAIVLVSRAGEQFATPITGGRPQTHARPVWDMRQVVYVTVDGVTHASRFAGASKTGMVLIVDGKTIIISATPPPPEPDWMAIAN